MSSSRDSLASCASSSSGELATKDSGIKEDEVVELRSPPLVREASLLPRQQPPGATFSDVLELLDLLPEDMNSTQKSGEETPFVGLPLEALVEEGQREDGLVIPVDDPAVAFRRREEDGDENEASSSKRDIARQMIEQMRESYETTMLQKLKLNCATAMHAQNLRKAMALEAARGEGRVEATSSSSGVQASSSSSSSSSRGVQVAKQPQQVKASRKRRSNQKQPQASRSSLRRKSNQKQPQQVEVFSSSSSEHHEQDEECKEVTPTEIKPEITSTTTSSTIPDPHSTTTPGEDAQLLRPGTQGGESVLVGGCTTSNGAAEEAPVPRDQWPRAPWLFERTSGAGIFNPVRYVEWERLQRLSAAKKAMHSSSASFPQGREDGVSSSRPESQMSDCAFAARGTTVECSSAREPEWSAREPKPKSILQPGIYISQAVRDHIAQDLLKHGHFFGSVSSNTGLSPTSDPRSPLLQGPAQYSISRTAAPPS